MNRLILWFVLAIWIIVGLGCGQYEFTDPTGATVTVLQDDTGQTQRGPTTSTGAQR
jgi:hypothetical protein